MSRLVISVIVRFGWSLCPDGWHADPQTSWCYKPFETGFEKSWNAAESHCQSFGGDLAAVNSKRKGNIVRFKASYVLGTSYVYPLKRTRNDRLNSE